MFSIFASVALVLVGLFLACIGWLAIMRFRLEPELITREAARGGWVSLLVGLAAIVFGMASRRGMSRNAIISYWCSKGVESE